MRLFLDGRIRNVGRFERSRHHHRFQFFGRQQDNIYSNLLARPQYHFDRLIGVAHVGGEQGISPRRQRIEPEGTRFIAGRPAVLALNKQVGVGQKLLFVANCAKYAGILTNKPDIC